MIQRWLFSTKAVYRVQYVVQLIFVQLLVCQPAAEKSKVTTYEEVKISVNRTSVAFIVNFYLIYFLSSVLFFHAFPILDKACCCFLPCSCKIVQI